MLHHLSAFGAAFRAIQVLAVLSAIVALVLAGPEQMLDVYAALPQDLIPLAGLGSILDDESGLKALAAACLGAVALILLCLALWTAGKSVLQARVAPLQSGAWRAAAGAEISARVARVAAAAGLAAVGQITHNDRSAGRRPQALQAGPRDEVGAIRRRLLDAAGL